MPYKKGDRIQNINSGIFGTVYQDQTDPLLVHLNWDKYPGQIECYKADAVRLAPWHEINLKDYTPDPDWKPVGFLLELNLSEAVRSDAEAEADAVHIKNFYEAGLLLSSKDIKEKYGTAVKAAPKEEPKFRAGDRVKFKFARRCGTVRGYHKEGGLVIEWDNGGVVRCPEEDVVVLHAPRDTDPVNPNQDAIDAIKALREPLKAEIEALQQKLGNLTKAQKLLERG